MKNRRKVLIISVIIAVVTAAVIIGLFTVLNDRKLDNEQAEFVEQLKLKAGSYDEHSIVLTNTNKYEAEKLAEQFGARLRISKNGKYAVLYLPDDTSIIDISSDKANKKYISAITPNYYTHIAETEETDEEIYVKIARQPDYEVSDQYYSYQTYLNYLNLGSIWQSTKGEGITIAVIDSGIDTDHPEFAGRISEWSYNATYDKIVKDYDNDWSLIEDEYGHGTAVAGVIGAALDGEGITGILPNAELLIIKAECDNEGNYKTSDLVFGLYYAIERDVPVVNMSFAIGKDPNDIDPFEDAAILAYDSDIICIAAAGNDSSSNPIVPATSEHVIGVGALKEDSWELADYSNYGDNIEVAAPGTVFTTAKGGGYKHVKGTSYSTPIVTAAAALYKKQIGYYESNDKFNERLHASCYDLGDKGPDFFYGYGAVDFSALLIEPTGTVTFDLLTDESDNIEQLFVYGHPIQDVPEPERLYAVFDGWYYDSQFTEELVWYEDSYNADVTLYAKWANENDVIPYDYRILDDGTVEILGYKGKRRFITIPDYIEGRQVSSIGRGAFSYNTRLRRIILPHYLVNIEDNAFRGCTGIVNMTLPSGVLHIGEFSFAECPRLTSINLGNSLQTVGTYAFYSCGYLTSIYLPETVMSVDGTAFAGDVSMLSITTGENNPYYMSIDGVLYTKSKSTIVAYPAALTDKYELMDETTTVGVCAFCCSSAYTVDLRSVKLIDDGAFECSKIRYVEIPDSCISLGDSAFNKCGYLYYVSIGRGLEEIPSEAFLKTGSLGELFIPNNIKLIGESAFEESGLQTVTFEEDSRLNTIGFNAFKESGLISIDIPESVVYISNQAFAKCYYLSSVTFGENSDLQTLGDKSFYQTFSLHHIDIPSKLRSIGDQCFSESDLVGKVYVPATLTKYGEGAFSANHRLTDIKVDADNEQYVDVDGVVYNTDHTLLVEYPAGKTAHEFCPLDTTVTIYGYAFYGNKQIDYMTLHDSVTTVNQYAFYKCKTIKEYRLSENLEYVGQYSFADNLSLTYLMLPDSLMQLSRYTFAGDINLHRVEISEGSKMKRIGIYAFAESGIEEFRVTSQISSVAQYAFEGCNRLRRVVFAENSCLQSISAYFFLGCDSIEEIIFENGSQLTSIQAHGLHGLTNLHMIDFGDAQIENIDNYAFRQCPALEEINLPDTVKNIGRFAFYRCENLKSVTVPENIEHIGEYAFLGTNHLNLYFVSEVLPIYLDENWDSGIEGYYTGVAETVSAGDWEYAVLKNGSVSILKYTGTEKNIDLTKFEYGTVRIIGGYAFAYTDIESVILPDSLEQIQRYAFAECTSLKSVVIPENVTFIAQYAFYRTGVESVTFAGDGLKVIEQYAFSATKDLSGINLPGSLEKLGTGAFYQSGITYVSFGDGFSLQTIPENAFAETKLTSVVIPDCVTDIGNNAFSHNHALKNVDLGRGENLMIRSNAFYNTGLTSLYIGKNVSFIGEYAFMDLDGLTAFTIDDNNPYFTVEDGVLYNKEKTKIISVPAGKTGSFVIPKEIEVLGFGAFENSKLSEITIEDGSELVTLGYRVFYGAKGLTSFTVPKSVISIDYYAFAECDKLKTVTFEEGNRLSGIYEGAFFGCRSLENIIFPDTIVEISDYAFYACESLDRLPFTEDSEVLGIYDYAFAYTNIEDLDLPSQLYDIGEFAFRGIAIKELVIDPDDPRVLQIGIGAFADCNRLESVTLPFTGESLNDADNYWFGFIFGSDDPHYDPDFVPESLKNITITMQTVYNYYDESSQKIYYSFYELPCVETVALPEDTYYLGPETFCEFVSLKEFEIPRLLTVIEWYTFWNCRSLKEAYIPDGVIYIDKDAFLGCESLATLRLNDNLIYIDSYYGTFNGCAFSEINLPDSLEYIGQRAFQNCFNLKSVVIPEKANIKDSDNLFAGCSSLQTVTMKCNAIGPGMFGGCYNLKTLNLIGDIMYIGGGAFSDCEKLDNIDFSPNLEYIGEGAFSGCKSLCGDIVLPEGLKTIGRYAFAGSGITSVVIPSTVTELNEATFRFCDNLRSVDIRAHIKSLPGDCFYNWFNNNIEEIKLPDTLEIIESGSFKGFAKLRMHELPASLKIIGSEAFAGCSSITEIVLPENLITIEDNAFGSCYNLNGDHLKCSIYSIINNSDLAIGFSDTDFGCVAANAYVIKDKLGEHYPDNRLSTADGMLYTEEENGYTFIGYIGSEKTVAPPAVFNGKPVFFEIKSLIDPHIKLIIPEGAETVYFRTDVDEVVLPSTLNYFAEGDGLHWNFICKISRITVAEGNETYWSNGEVLCTQDGYAVYGTFGHETLTIPEGVTTVGESACLMRNMEHIVLPDSLTEIKAAAFSDCRNLKDIVLPGSVKTVGNSAFSGCSSLTAIDFGNCENILEYAFSATGFESITIPGKIKNISARAFEGCGNLKTVIIEEGVESIGDSAFGCDIENISLPESLKSIGAYAFEKYTGEFHITENIQTIGDNAFANASKITVDENNPNFILYDGVLYSAGGSSVVWIDKTKTHITLLPMLTEIGEKLFFNNHNLESVTIPEGVTRIHYSAFEGCENLKSVTLPETLRIIDGLAFYNTGLEEIYLPASVESVGYWSFSENINTITVTVDENNKKYFMKDGVLYDGESAIFATAGVSATVVIPEGIVNIEDRAFKNSSIKKIVLPSTLKRIGRFAFESSELCEIVWSDSVEEVWDGAFCRSKITELILPDSVTIPHYSEGSVCVDCGELKTVYIPAGMTDIDPKMFDGCRSLESITVSDQNENYYSYSNVIYKKGTNEFVLAAYYFPDGLTLPDGITEIPDEAFKERRGIGSIIISDSVKSIYRAAFCGTEPFSVKIPASVKFMADDAFAECYKLKLVENESDLDIYPGCNIFQNSIFVINKGVASFASDYDWRYYIDGDFICSEYIGDSEEVENRYRVNAYIGDLTELTLPTEIGGHTVVPYSFEPGTAETLKIAEGVEYIPEYAFYSSGSLKRLVLPSSVREFGANAFADSYLTEINIPYGILTIEPWTFSECSKLSKVTLPDDLLYKIDKDAFYRCYALKTIDLPDSLLYIEDEAFYQAGIEHIDLPPYLKSIGHGAFRYTRLRSITIPDSVEDIGREAFLGAPLEAITLPDTDLFLGAHFITDDERVPEGYFMANEDNWDGDFLYVGSHLIKYRGNDIYVVVDRDVKSICESAFDGCYNVKYLEISGNGFGALMPQYLTNLEMLIIRHEPTHNIANYFRDYYWSTDTDVPDTLRSVVIKENAYIEHRDEFKGVAGIFIFVENVKSSAPFDRIAPGWNNENIVTYGDKWYMATFFDENGTVISKECFRNSQAIRPPYVVLPKSGETAYTHIGWDIDGDGEPDGLPASRLSDIEAYAVVKTSKPAYYTVKFVDIDRKTVIEKYTLEYGQPITAPANAPEKKGYTFIGWENLKEDDTVNEDVKIYSVWSHNGTGHEYAATVVEPTCTERGYTLHKCSICDDEYRTDYVAANWHTFGDWIVDKEPSCSENGEKHRICEVCGFREDAVIDTVGHSYETAVLKESTCTERGIVNYTCSVCGDVIQEMTPLLPHEFEKVYADKDYIKWLDEEFFGIVWGCDGETYWYYTCKHCGKIETVTLAKASGVGGHTHQYSAILNNEGKAVAVKCSLCGEVQCHEHIYEPSGEHNGAITYICVNCGDVMTAQKAYMVKFVNYDNTVISEAEYHYGDSVTVPSDPTKPNDNTYMYSFAGWDKEVTTVNDNITYTATYTPEYINYTVRFVDYDNTVLSEKTYHYNDTVIAPDNPVREKDGQYTYTFAGWDKDITLCKGDTTYKAKYTSEENVYTITFKNYDGAVIAVQALYYNETVTPPADPERASDNTYSYSFAGWDKEIVPVKADAEYIATYKEAFIEYTVKFVDHDDTVLSEKTYHYGDSVTVPNDPVRYDDNEYTYTFNGWDKEITVVTGDATYKAVYDRAEKVPEFIPGDINGDGELNNKDVVVLFRYVSGGEAEVNEIALDTNGDNEINNKDVVVLFRYVSGGEVELSDKPYTLSIAKIVIAMIHGKN